MKCSAVDEDIVHLFGIMLGRKPSPASYVEDNRGAPLRELAGRMVSSREFQAKVLEPILSGHHDTSADRDLNTDERVWLRSSAQLPSELHTLLERRPTRHQAALALGLRALEGPSRQDPQMRTTVTSAIRLLGGHRDDMPERSVRPARPRKSTAPGLATQLGPVDANRIWSLLGGGHGGGDTAPFMTRTSISDLANEVSQSKVLTDHVVPRLYACEAPSGPCWYALPEGERQSWAMASGVAPDTAPPDLLGLLGAASTHARSPLAATLDAVARIDDDNRDAVEALHRIAEIHRKIRALVSDGQVGGAMLLVRRHLADGAHHLTQLFDEVEGVFDALSDWRDRLLGTFFLSQIGPETAFPEGRQPRRFVTLTRETAMTVNPADTETLFVVLDEDVTLTGSVKSMLSITDLPASVTPIRACQPSIPIPTSLLSFPAEICGFATQGAAELRDAMEIWNRRGTFVAERFIPAISGAPASLPEPLTAADQPVIIGCEGANLPKTPFRTVSMQPGQTLCSTLTGLDLAPSAPVILLGASIDYSADYIDHALAHYTRLAEPEVLPLLTIAFSSSEGTARIADMPADGGEISPFVWLPMSVLQAKIATRIDGPADQLSDRLYGARDLQIRDGSGQPAKPVFGVRADAVTLCDNAKTLEDLLQSWQDALTTQNPPIAPNLIGMSELRAEAATPIVARRLIARRLICEVEQTIAVLEQVAANRINPDELDAIALPATTDRLMDFGLHDALLPITRDLLGSTAFCAGASRHTIIWLLEMAQAAGFQAEAATSLRGNVRLILKNDATLARQIFDFLAGHLLPQDLSHLLIQSASDLRGTLTPRGIRLFADVMRLYGDQSGALEFLEICPPGHGTGETVPRPVKNRLSSALVRGAALSLSDRPLALDWDPNQHLSHDERIRQSVSAQDHASLLPALRMRLAEAPDALGMLDPLRAMTLELAGFGFGPGEIPYHACEDDVETAIMAQMFGDKATMEALLATTGLRHHKHLGALLACSLGNAAPLQDLLETLARPLEIAAPRIEAGSPRQIFDAYRNAEAPAAPDSAGLVSVIISSLDTDPILLREAIGSVLGQTYQEIEILLIDDGSSPGLAADLRDAAGEDERIRAFSMPRNLGPYLCRNFALSLARGSYIAIQDADDISHPQRLAAQIALMSQNPDLQLVASDHLRIDPRGWPQFEHRFALFGDGTMSSTFRRSIFDRLGPFLPVRSRGDVEFRERIRRWCGAGAIHHIAFPLLACHASAQTLSQRTVLSKGNFLQLFRKAVDEIRFHPSHLARSPVPPIAIPPVLQA